MSDLAELVNHIRIRDDLPIPDSGVLNRLDALENTRSPTFGILNSNAGMFPEGRISVYAKALMEYEQGLNAGFEYQESGGKSVELHLSRLGRPTLGFFEQGFTAGYVINAEMAKGEGTHNDTASASYRRLKAQLRQWTATLIKELEKLAEANSDPSKFLLNNIYLRENIEASHGAAALGTYTQIVHDLKLVIAQYQDFTRDLLRSRISQREVKELEGKSDLEANIKIGLYYLLNRQPYEAGAKLRDACNRSNDGNLSAALGAISSNTLIAQRFLEPAYDTINLARKFELKAPIAA